MTAGNNGNTNLDALGGGQLLLHALTTLSNSGINALAVESNGSNSEVDISALTSFTTDNSAGQLTVTNSGEVLDGDLTTMSGVNVSLDGTGTVATSQWASITSGGITVTGGVYSLSGLTDVDNSSLFAQGGGSLTLGNSNLTSYQHSTYAGTITFEASGTGSTLSLPALTSVEMTAGNNGNTNLEALGGGQLLLHALTTLSNSGINALAVKSDGSGSEVDISALTSFTTDNSAGQLTVTNSGEVLDGDLTTMSGVNVSLDGTGTVATSQWASITSGGITVTGGTYSLSGLTDVDNSSLYAQGGGSLTLGNSNLTGYQHSTFAGTTTFEASGTGSTLSLPALTSVEMTAGNNGNTNLDALGGGRLLLHALTTLSNSGINALAVESNGSNSEVDVSALTSFTTDNSAGQLTVTNSGEVLDGDLTTMSGVNVTLDGTGTVATSQWASITSGGITVTGGTYSLSGLTDVDNSSLYAQGGGSLTLGNSNLTSYQHSTFAGTTTFEASGTGSTLSLPALTSVEMTAGNNGNTDLEALGGGQLLLHALTTLSNAGNNALTVESDGSNSEVDLSSLTGFMTDNEQGRITVTDSGTLLTGDLAAISGVNVSLDGTGTWSTSSITSASNGTYTQVGYAPPVAGSGVTISVPAMPQGLLGLTQNVSLSGSYTGGPTIDIPSNDDVAISGGSLSGGADF